MEGNVVKLTVMFWNVENPGRSLEGWKLEAGQMPLNNAGDQITLLDNAGNQRDRAACTRYQAKQGETISFLGWRWNFLHESANLSKDTVQFRKTSCIRQRVEFAALGNGRRRFDQGSPGDACQGRAQ